MSPSDSGAYHITLVGDVAQRIKALAEKASNRGQIEAYVDALDGIVSRLTQDPSQFGEYCYGLLNGDIHCHVGAMNPIALRFSIHEKSRNVYITRVFLMGS